MTTVWPQSGSTEVLYHDGSYSHTSTSGYSSSYDAKTGRYKSTRPDGSGSEWDNNGYTKTIKADGSYEEHFKDGSFKKFDNKGNLIESYPNPVPDTKCANLDLNGVLTELFNWNAP